MEYKDTSATYPNLNDKDLLAKLKDYWDVMKQHYSRDHKRMQLLDATDRGDIWKALRAQFPKYQILPDTNHVAYVKSNILASIYTVTKGADIIPTSEQDKEIIVQLNIARERIWDMANVGYYQFLAGDRAALLNMGITQVGWDETLTAGSGDSFYKGNISLKNIDPIKFMRDPFAVDLDTSGYCCTYDIYHKCVFLQNPNYKETFKQYVASNKDKISEQIPEHTFATAKSNAKDYYTLVTWFVREGNKVNEIHVINHEVILWRKDDIKPSEFPFAELYSNLPSGALVGTSEPAKIFANSVAYNVMDSIALTAEYKNQRPPKFISTQSGLNVQAFAKHGDEADKTFVVNGPADKAVHYHQFPQVGPIISNLKMSLEKNIEGITGIDGRYTGRDTGSIITTGGTQEMLNRVTLIDAPKILNYENYSNKLTKLILANFIRYAPKRKYFYKKPNSTKWETLVVDFPTIDNDTLFNYSINISSELPKNKQRIAAQADMLMEKQMQYQEQGSSVQLITEEEWLMMQDLPNKEFMLERMGIQRLSDATEEVSQVLFQYADLVRNGVSPDQAILATAESLKNKRMGQMPEPGPMAGMGLDSQLPPQGPMNGGGMAPPMM